MTHLSVNQGSIDATGFMTPVVMVRSSVAYRLHYVHNSMFVSLSVHVVSSFCPDDSAPIARKQVRTVGVPQSPVGKSTVMKSSFIAWS